MLIKICTGCGRTIEKKFIYCPWCGVQTAGLNSARGIENRAEHIMDLRMNEQEQQIETVGKQIEDLEKELNILVLSNQMAR